MKERHFRREVKLEDIINLIPYLPRQNLGFQRIFCPLTVSPSSVFDLPNPLLTLAISFLFETSGWFEPFWS
jgi:hypothetical protein